MRDLIQDRLPSFTEDEATALKGSFDFIGLNHYTAHYVKSDPNGPLFSRYGVEPHDAQVAIFSMFIPFLLVSLRFWACWF